MSKRDTAIERNRQDAHYAILNGKQPQFQQPIPEHKERKKSLDPSEHQEQQAVVSWWYRACAGYRLPPIALFSIPNGAVLRGDQVQRAIQVNYMKAEGMRNGAPDLVLAYPSGDLCGLYIEMKTRRGYQSPEQINFMQYLRSVRYRYELCRGADEGIDAIKRYMEGR